MNIFDRWIIRRADKMTGAAVINRPLFEDSEPKKPGTFYNEQSHNNTFTLYRCVNGHLLEVWSEAPKETIPSLNRPGRGTERTQRMYIIPEGHDVINAVAQALVSERLEK